MYRSLLLLLVLSLTYLFALSVQAKNSPKQIPTITEFTQGMNHKKGFFDFYYQPSQDKIYVQVDRFNQAFLFQSSLPQGLGSNDVGLDRGQLGKTRIVHFERYGNKVMLKQLNTEFRVSSNNLAERASIDEAFADSVIAGFVIAAQNSKAVLIDYTDFLHSDIHQVTTRLKQSKQGDYKLVSKRSGIVQKRTKAFPDNIEMEALLTFVGSKPGEYVRQVAPEPTSISVHTHHSLVRLPDDQYKPRAFHPYSGYWNIEHQDYSVAIDKPLAQRFIPRHRLFKKDPSAKVSEAVEPIIYYLDPGIPEPVKSALRDGALWWNQGFEAIGYKNAFQVKTLPATADPMDVRYNVIQWVHRATRGWSYGSSVIDPRTGEIIKGHVTLGSLRVRQDYLIALGLTSPFDVENADTTKQQEMALARIRQLSAHEVGHTLGIAHNFAASAQGRASVMDYPHPKVTVKDGKVSLDGAYDVGLGVWDKHVVAYGYQHYLKPQQEEQGLDLQLQQTRDKGLLFQSDPDARSPASANSVGHLWDGGKTPLQELQRISDVRQVALNQFGLNSLPHNTTLSSLEERLAPIYLLHRYQLDAVAKLIGGVYYEYESKGDYSQAKGVSIVAADQQRAAINALIETALPNYLALPHSITRLITPKAYGETRTRESFKGRTGPTFDPISAAESAAGYSISLLLNVHRLNRLSQQHDGNNTPSVRELLDSLLGKTLMANQGSNTVLQQRINFIVLNQLMESLDHQELAPEVRAELSVVILDLQKWLNKKGRITQNRAMAKQLEMYWQTGRWISTFKLKPLPPGSPI
ncbi:zinc-dependent metalloprotease [Agarilytica rhodophyticola]|uniref:zinc-dependent metalloprotease n=1 Tax=Agarilytica rhodophyticola TaxID=1737490 RepID=UPI000B345249|nr:zinc-dependent metalloprotease [Agarilytica rhodophyticola]